MGDYGAYAEKIKKGDLGEEFIFSHLRKIGYDVEESDHAKAHKFDGFILEKGIRRMLMDVKVKPKRKSYDDTGIDIEHFHVYTSAAAEYKLPFAIFFLDEDLSMWYWDLLHKLEIPYFDQVRKIQYPWNQTNRWGKTLRYYHLNQFTPSHWHPLPPDIVDQFRKLNVSKFNKQCYNSVK